MPPRKSPRLSARAIKHAPKLGSSRGRRGRRGYRMHKTGFLNVTPMGDEIAMYVQRRLIELETNR